MKFSISSDLHIDNRHDRDAIKQAIINSGADVNIIAGDIANGMKDSFDFVKDMSQTLSFAGNHEFYDRTTEINNNGDFHEFGGVSIFTGTLWTDFNNGDPLTEFTVFNGLNDSFWIKDYSIEQIKKINRIQREMIFDVQPEIVVTHHAPSRQSVAVDLDNMTPEAVMLKAIMVPRYDLVDAAA